MCCVMPGFHHSVAVLPLPFCRSAVVKFRCSVKNYVREFRPATAVNGKKIRNGNGNGNGVWKRQRLTGTAKRQRKNGNGVVETRHNAAHTVQNAVCWRLYGCIQDLMNGAEIKTETTGNEVLTKENITIWSSRLRHAIGQQQQTKEIEIYVQNLSSASFLGNKKMYSLCSLLPVAIVRLENMHTGLQLFRRTDHDDDLRTASFHHHHRSPQIISEKFYFLRETCSFA